MVGMGFPAWMAGGICDLMKLVDAGSPAAVYDSAALEALLTNAPYQRRLNSGSVKSPAASSPDLT